MFNVVLMHINMHNLYAFVNSRKQLLTATLSGAGRLAKLEIHATDRGVHYSALLGADLPKQTIL